jgi:GntR family transcriptional regulator
MIKPVRISSKTLTEVAEQELRKAILGGEYPPGGQLPSEAELIDMLGVSRTTVREALRSLEESGIVLRRHGIGTFVLERPIINNFGMNYGITEMIQMANMTPGTRELNIFDQKANEEVANQLGIAIGTDIKCIERVRTSNNKPVVYSVDYLPLSVFEVKSILPEMLANSSLYDLLQLEFNINIEYGVARISPILASKKIADKLNQEKNSILLFISQTDYMSNDKPVLYTHEYNIPNAFKYQFLRRRPSKIQL